MPGIGRGAYLVLAPAAAGFVIAYLSSLAMQLALALGAIAVAMATFLGRTGRVLDPAWVIVGIIYLIGPVGFVVSELGIGLSLLAVMAVGFAPFAIAALIVAPEIRTRLLLLAPLVGLVVWFAVSTVWSPDAAYGTEKLSIWIVGALVPAAYVFILGTAGQRISWRAIAIAAVLYAIALLMVGGRHELYPDRITLLEENPIWAARAAGIGAVIMLFGPFRPLAKVAAIPILVAAAIATSSLGPMVGLGAGVLAGSAVLLWRARANGRRTGPGWFALGLSFALGSLVLMSGLLDSVFSPLSADPNVTSRADFLGVAFDGFLGSPLVGIGGGGFAATGLQAYPHNIIAETAMELGFIGLVLFGTWTVLALIGAARSPLLVALVVSTLGFAAFSGSLATNTDFWLFSAFAVAQVSLAVLRASQRPAPAAVRRHVAHET